MRPAPPNDLSLTTGKAHKSVLMQSGLQEYQIFQHPRFAGLLP